MHSFERKTFLEILLDDVQAERLSVWSPYFSIDLAGLLEKIRGVADRDLQFSLVPDRVGNRHVRTKWTEALGKMLSEDALSFHDRPSPRAKEMEMTHAKIWLAKGRTAARLAIGSWNCTEPGSASFDLRNVEAGIVLDVPLEACIVGPSLNLVATDFGSDEMLEDEALIAPSYTLPFELVVRFDWEKGKYDLQGCWLDEGKEVAGYDLRLPGVQKRIPLQWRSRRRQGVRELETIELELADNEALLADHSYEVWRAGNLEFRGLVQETGQDHRRAQAYDSLNDLLNDLVNGNDPGTSGMPRLRTVLRHDDVPDDVPASLTFAAGAGGLSYFRVFHAFEQFRQRLRDVARRDELDRVLFVLPGSLQELVGKVNAEVATSSGSAVFNWFLLQEVDTLHALALEAHGRTRRKYERSVPPSGSKWESLKPNKRAARLPVEIRSNAVYMRRLRGACDYGR